MNETKKSGGMSVWVMLLIIAGLFVGIKLIFWGIQHSLKQVGGDIHVSVLQENGRPSQYGVRRLSEEERKLSDVQIWLDGVEDEEAEDTVYWLYRQAEDEYLLYMPEQDRVLADTDLTADEKRQEDGEITLVLRARTPEDAEEVEPEDQILAFNTTSEKWRGIRVRVLLDGREQTVEKRVATGPEIHTTEEVYIGRF